MELKEKSITERELENPPNIWRLNNILLTNTWVKENNSREMLKYFDLGKNQRRVLLSTLIVANISYNWKVKHAVLKLN